MQIHELAALSGCNPETIRMYRSKGLLMPARNKSNGYYEYSVEDLTILLYIRRLRKNHLSLPSISTLFNTHSVEGLLQDYQEEIASLQQEIAALQEQLYLLNMMADHLKSCLDTEQRVSMLHVADARYDLYQFERQKKADEQQWLDRLMLHTTALRITGDPAALGQSPCIPCQAGIGTYETVIRKYDLSIPEHAVCCPPGLYLTRLIRLNSLDCIPAEQVLPLKDFAEAHRLRLTGDSTAFLLRVAYIKGRPEFWFRLRIRAENKEPLHR